MARAGAVELIGWSLNLATHQINSGIAFDVALLFVVQWHSPVQTSSSEYHRLSGQGSSANLAVSVFSLQ